MTRKHKYILTDVDDTVLDFTRPFQDWARKKGYEFEGCMREMDGGGIPRLLGIDREEADRLVTEFTLESEEFGNLPPEPCAAEVLPRLKKAGCQFVAITATIDSKENHTRRFNNLYRAFGFPFIPVYLTGLGQSKERWLKTFDPTIWVEDNFEHAVNGAEACGHQSIIIDRTYNSMKSHPLVHRVRNWHEIAELI